MSWRASAKLVTGRNLGSVVAFLGAASFVVSDNILSYDMMIQPLPAASLLIMPTYYLAQLGFALSVVYFEGTVRDKLKES